MTPQSFNSVIRVTLDHTATVAPRADTRVNEALHKVSLVICPGKAHLASALAVGALEPVLVRVVANAIDAVNGHPDSRVQSATRQRPVERR
jgi:C4-dicarboxylate-specific signal transduction histidine kinase